MRCLGELLLWIDADLRTGPEAMAVDEWLLETAKLPVLRIYGWDGEWASVGYFGKIEEAKRSLSCGSWVRRLTGGGIVDHRADWTYTLVIPKSEALANTRGAESYLAVHSAVSKALAAEGIRSSLSGGDQETGEGLCFENPVTHDLVDQNQRKLAGAGQRRTSHGLMHQGSVAIPISGAMSTERALRLARELAEVSSLENFFPTADEISRRVNERYGIEKWTLRR
jgi:lipoyl(octanoyl) transferase